MKLTYNDDALSQMVTYEWFICFKNGGTSMDDNELSGQPSTSRSKPLIAQVKNVIHGNHQLTLQAVAEEVGISTGSSQTILTEDLGMHHVSAKFVLRLFNDQKLQ
jgi:AraC-like DNA-binding protein